MTANIRQKKVAAALLLLQEQESVLLTLNQYMISTEQTKVKKSVENFYRIVFRNIWVWNLNILTFLRNLCSDDISRIDSIPAPVRIHIFLKYAREGRSQNYLAQDLGISQFTVSRIVNNVVDKLKSSDASTIAPGLTPEEFHGTPSTTYSGSSESSDTQ
ncbi:Protein CBG21395 [Caenorhabditis briggsae]|uniref:Protein CBG21395 n=1 Tax=Caenorhabditis briggsae TaxID=6238 RepID=A8XZZ6_CAEBR|nr:Protein CBG21395 [Caenorhabditis briggsae]CAP38213.1 Protein CBG21395 [Caenorhabditis briggsae]